MISVYVYCGTILVLSAAIIVLIAQNMKLRDHIAVLRHVAEHYAGLSGDWK